MTDSCSSCFFGQTFLPQTTHRLCRFRPPTVGGSSNITDLWPIVEDADWCGSGADATSLRLFDTSVSDVTTVAKLPVGVAPGTRMMVTDASGNMNTFWGSPVAGGGTYDVPVYMDSANTWRVG